MYGLQTTKRSHKRYDIRQYNNVALGSQVSYNVFDVVFYTWSFIIWSISIRAICALSTWNDKETTFEKVQMMRTLVKSIFFVFL